MASATGLFHLNNQDWDQTLLKSCGLTTTRLPKIAGRIEPQRRSKLGQLGTIFCPIGDGAASNLGSGGNRQSIAAINVGTSGAVRTIRPPSRASLRRLPTGLFCYVVDSDRWIVGGAISNAGNLREWCLRELRLDNHPPAIERVLSRDAAAKDPLTILPFLVEERAPSWPEAKHGVMAGLTQATTADQMARAAVTATFYRLAEILDALENAYGRVKQIVVSGGILKSPASLKILADALGRDLQVSSELEASLRGAAIHVLTHLGVRVKAKPPAKTVKHNRALSRLHRDRRERQSELEKEQRISR